MKQEIEIEFKMLLTKHEYQLLLDKLPFPEQAISQTNYYFETKNFLLKNNQSALRIRKKNNTFTLTLKQPYKVGILETHDILTEEEALHWLKEKPTPTHNVCRQLNEMNISSKELIHFGYLTTVRREFKKGHLLYVLDHSTYNGQSDYELEIESTTEQEGQEAFNSLIKDYSIENKQTPTKIERFFNTLER